MNKGLLGYYNYTVILTYIGMLIGLTGIIGAMQGRYYFSVICLMIAAVCDMFDGAIASTMQRTMQERCFGIQIDSLSDLLCFGVLPGILIYNLGDKSTFAFVATALFILCALIRLAYFNVDEQERQQASAGGREFYYGLPVTLSALFVPLAMEMCSIFGWKLSVVGSGLLMIMGLLFLTPFRLKKPHAMGKLCVFSCGAAEFALVMLGMGDI